jgi:hypothetical protein
MTEQVDHKLVGDAIGRFAQIERCKFSGKRTSSSHGPVWVLVRKPDHTPYARFLKLRDECPHESLLCVLHTHGFLSDHSWRLHRLRHEHDLNGSFVARFEEVHRVEEIVISPVGNGIFPKGKMLFQTRRPFCLIELTVSRQSISSSTGTVTRNELSFIDLAVCGRQHVAKQDGKHPGEAVTISEIGRRVHLADFLLTLDIQISGAS